MSSNNPPSPGAQLADRLLQAIAAVGSVLVDAARNLPALTGLTPTCQFSLPMENVLVSATNLLVASGRVYRYSDSVDLEEGCGPDARLCTLRDADGVTAQASAKLSNLFVCEQQKGDQTKRVQFAPPRDFVATLLNREPTLETFPQIRTYVRRPVFGPDFAWCGPGYHSDSGILVHGVAAVPIDLVGQTDATLPVIQRLPPHLANLFEDFAFREDADCANAVAAMLTGVLVHEFREAPKPVFLVDGNQPGTGKTLLAGVMGMLLDGAVPTAVNFTPDDDELGKRLCATLRDLGHSIVLLDNARVRAGQSIESSVIEAQALAPLISIRILGKSSNFMRPNDVLWVITMNGTQASRDLCSRSVPIRFYYEGDPAERDFEGRNPVEYARHHRAELLGELAGMVIRWTACGRPTGSIRHRCAHWAEVVGGIMEANGLPEFLTNFNDASNEFDSDADLVAALVEAAQHNQEYVTWVD